MFTRLLSDNGSTTHLWVVVKMVLALFHGQAAVESGFSVNEDILVENLTEQSIMAQRAVLNAIQYYGGVLDVSLTTALLNSVKAASRRRNVALEQRRSVIQKNNTNQKRDRELDESLQKIQATKANLEQQMQDLESQASAIKKQKTGF